MSSANNNPPWQPPAHLRHLDDGFNFFSQSTSGAPSSRARTPNTLPEITIGGAESGNIILDGEPAVEEDPRAAEFDELFRKSEAKIASLFSRHDDAPMVEEGEASNEADIGLEHGRAAEGSTRDAAPPPKKAARAINEDDYDDYDEDEEEEAPAPLSRVSTAKDSSTVTTTATASPTKPGLPATGTTSPAIKLPSSREQEKSSDEVRKKLEEDKKAAEAAAKASFNTLIYTLENDRDAMLDQQKLDESERQVDAEMSGPGGSANNANNTSAGGSQPGSLSSANLGASSLTLKHLIARIDAKRDQVRASDAELRSLMSEVRKNRSKWASEDKVGQEELYEAAEKVLSELKAMTEHSTAFLSRVNKREAPDYYNVIKHPMDLGTMTKKLKGLQYKSKKEFVDDLNLIWSNCLKYNANPEHFLRKHALYMRKETEKLVPLIPDIVIRDRAEVEAEERRLQNAEADLEGGEESDDEPIMSSRGRKAPGMKSKKGTTVSRTAPTSVPEGTPGAEAKPPPGLPHSNSGTNLKNEFLRADSDAPMEGSQTEFSTPPPGSITPAGANGASNSGAQSDAMDIDGIGPLNGLESGLGGARDDTEYDSLEFKTWKQVTKKDRARVAAERHRLFQGDHLNPDEPALLRTKAGMRRWLRKRREAVNLGAAGDVKVGIEDKEVEPEPQGSATLAEGMEGEEEPALPDYYDVLAGIPELPERLRWLEDSEGQIIDPSEEYMRVVPKGQFTSPHSTFAEKMEANMRQMQETRKVCAKIGIVKQMQLQSQMYQNQFQKYDPDPFVEQDIPPHVVSDDGPVMAPWVCRAALQRSVGKLFYHAGFEEFQPSALDAVTDIAGDFFARLVHTLGVYREVPKVPEKATVGPAEQSRPGWKNRFSTEEIILHAMHEHGINIEALESYVKDDVDRLSSKLANMHERMKAHLAELLRPALGDAGPDGSSAFNDGSEQFVGGDFAEEIDEDFFGFRELGLDREFGLASLSVPLHLLQNRMHNAYTAQNTSVTSTAASAFPPPAPFDHVTVENIKEEIGLVQEFFLSKLRANDDQPLVEDEDLPQKQRFPKPRLPPTGKISSPRKRPLQQTGAGNLKKKKKLEINNVSFSKDDDSASGVNGTSKTGSTTTPTKSGGAGASAGSTSKPKLNLPGPPLLERMDSSKGSDADKDDATTGSGVGMMSPESITA
ncbi:hypothetical protein L228DRAFT_209467 [Xylona heveae TC161]|uniref:SAGA complex subunit Spt7 n=1 Tax=Xylona heveae (strain CBS 132557 / TC161) TaxID=1328760 RepID=A0A165I907_XYLHT|nr:hypothetical protein L228DRAFT_209467 [Xylona heveae TC161]KZF24561.1 hypothetical protein L228DRAFT_209467 [Xylona heveae TC161]